MKNRIVRHMMMLLIVVGPWLTDQSAAAQEDPHHNPGFQSDQVFQAGDIDYVNLFNGNLLLTIPVGSKYPAGPGLDYGLALSYNANLWKVETVCGQGDPGFRCENVSSLLPGFNAGAGWTLSMGRLIRGGTELNDLGTWLYITGDGGRHTFGNTLHHGEPDENPNQGPGLIDPDLVYYGYSRDGSYLRMRRTSTGVRRIEFPDGRFQEFTDPGTNDGEWLLKKIGDPFGSEVNISYHPSDQVWTEWRITDDHGRQQVVEFETTSLPEFPKRVKEVRLEAFGYSAARYEFRYYPTTELTRSCPHNLDNSPNRQDAVLLKEIVLPDGSSYHVTEYITGDPNAACTTGSGGVKSLRLPTRAQLEWQYGAYNFPVSCAELQDVVVPGDPSQFNNPSASGVVRKTRTLPGQAPEVWTYEPALVLGDITSTLCEDIQPNAVVNTVTDPRGTVTKNYFSVDRDNLNYSANEWTIYDYGLPLRKDISVSANRAGQQRELYLSSETWPPGVALTERPRRATYVAYEQDQPDGSGPDRTTVSELNRREVARRMVYLEQAAINDHFTEVLHDDFDGLGNYRFQVRGGSTNLSTDNRKTTTAYNPANGTYSLNAQGTANGNFVPPSVSDPWILKDHSFRELSHTQSGQSARSEMVFDPATGYLECRRTWKGEARGAHDTLEWFEDLNGDGYVERKKIYGGEGQSLDTSSPCALGQLPATAAYRIDQQYTFGSLSRQAFVEDDTGDEVQRSLLRTIDASTGLVASSTDAAGLVSSYVFDDMGRIIEDSPASELTTFYSYTPAAAATAAKVTAVRGDTEQVLLYDGLGRTCFAFDRQPDGAWSRQQTTYYPDGQSLRVSTQQYAGSLESQCSANMLGKYTHIYRDAWGRPAIETNPDGTKVINGRLGVLRKTLRMDVALPNGDAEVKKLHHYDAFGKVRRVVEAFNTSEQMQTDYRYDVGGRLRQVLAGTQTRLMEYDRRGYMTSETKPEIGASGQGTATYAYDARGNRISKTLGNTQLKYKYDGAGRLTQVREVVLAGERILLDYFYHRGNVGSQASAGKLYQARRHHYDDNGAASQPLTVTETLRYDGLGGRVSQQQVRLSNHGVTAFEHGMTYDSYGRPASESYPQCITPRCSDPAANLGRTVSYGYNRGKLTSVPGYAASITYHKNGLFHRLTHSNGIVDEQQNDPDQLIRPGRLFNTHWDSGVYSFDAAGNIKAIGGDSYRYDARRRIAEVALTSVASAGQQSRSYLYDSQNNLTRITRNGVGHDIAVDLSTNRLATASYDERGNLTSRGAGQPSYGWDALDTMLTMESADQSKAYLYTASGERFVEWDFSTEPLQLTWTVRGVDGKVRRQWQEDTGAAAGWQWLKDYVYRGGSLLASVDPQYGRRHFHLDHLGSTRAITAVDGSLVSSHTYFPFGEEVTPLTTDEQMRFTGHERDDNGAGTVDDLDYMHARYHSPYFGRFLSVDPAEESQKIGDPRSWNRYSYVKNNPLVYVDPDGRKEALAINGVFVLVGAGALFVSTPVGVAVVAAAAVNFLDDWARNRYGESLGAHLVGDIDVGTTYDQAIDRGLATASDIARLDFLKNNQNSLGEKIGELMAITETGIDAATGEAVPANLVEAIQTEVENLMELYGRSAADIEALEKRVTELLPSPGAGE